MRRTEFEKNLKEFQKVRVFDLDDDDSILNELYEKYPRLFEVVDENIDVDKHRWYELSTKVMQWGNWFIGFRGVSQCYSDGASLSDMDIYLEFFEMEKKIVETYEYSRVE